MYPDAISHIRVTLKLQQLGVSWFLWACEFPLSGRRPSRSSRFMDNLQTEVLEIEFLSYSKGLPTISEEDFARILLRYTNVDDVSAYLDNVRHSIPDEKVSVTFTLSSHGPRCSFSHNYNCHYYYYYYY